MHYSKSKMIVKYVICLGMLCSTCVLKASDPQDSSRREPVVSRLEQSNSHSELSFGIIKNNQTIERNKFGHKKSLDEHELKKIQNLITIRRQNPRRRYVPIVVVTDISYIIQK